MTQRSQCGQCGAILLENAQFCTRCGAPRVRRAALPHAPARDRARRARIPQLALAASIDLILLTALVAVLVLAGNIANDVNVWVLCAIVLVLAAAAHAGALAFTGQSLGSRIAGTRLVSSATGSAPGTRLTALRFMDLRGGEDPIEPQLAPFEVALGVRDATRGEASVAPNKKGWVLVIDEERRVALTGSFVVGRNPAVTTGETALAIPDLGRLLSKGHLRFDIDPDGTIFVTDLGSTNGSQLGADPLAPHQRAAITAEARIHAGDHVFRVENRARTLQGAKR